MSAGADGGAVGPAATVGAGLLARYRAVRARSLALAEPLSVEDQAVQSMPDASPVKWHLAHTTWFFETFVLSRRPGHAPFDPAYGYLFNSYYEAVGPRHARPQRGLLTRPSNTEVRAYRRHVDGAMEAMVEAGLDCAAEAARVGPDDRGVAHIAIVLSGATVCNVRLSRAAKDL